MAAKSLAKCSSGLSPLEWDIQPIWEGLEVSFDGQVNKGGLVGLKYPNVRGQCFKGHHFVSPLSKAVSLLKQRFFFLFHQ